MMRGSGRYHTYTTGDGGLCATTGWTAGFKRATCQLPADHALHNRPSYPPELLDEMAALSERYDAEMRRQVDAQLWGEPLEVDLPALAAVKRKKAKPPYPGAVNFNKRGKR